MKRTKRTILGVGFIGTQLMKDIVIKQTDNDMLFLIDNDRDHLWRAIGILKNLKNNDMLHGSVHILYGDVSNQSYLEEMGVITDGNDEKDIKGTFKACRSVNALSVIKDCIVYNLAARVGVKSWKESPYQNYSHNLAVDNHLQEMIRRYHCKKYVYASSSEVYGSSETPLTEDMCYSIPRDTDRRGLYSMEKAYGEITAEMCGCPYTVVRFFNIIGPYQDVTKGVFPKFFNNISQGKPVKASTDIRCFCDVRDASSALIALGEDVTDKSIGSFNISNPNNIYTIVELAQKMKEFLKSESEITTIEDSFIQKRIGDNALLSEFYQVKYNLDDTLKYYMKNVSNSN